MAVPRKGINVVSLTAANTLIVPRVDEQLSKDFTEVNQLIKRHLLTFVPKPSGSLACLQPALPEFETCCVGCPEQITNATHAKGDSRWCR
jgi:hypothetical protein